MITVGVANGRVAYVSSTAAGSQAAPAAATLTATQAWLRAAANAGVEGDRPPTSAPSPSATAGASSPSRASPRRPCRAPSARSASARG